MGDSLVIQGRYEVIRRLAIGGMGEIFLARQVAQSQKSFSRLVILKTLRPELSEQPDALDQFLDEARVAALLSHPNIVSIYEVGVHNGVHFIAMEYIGGIDVAALVRSAQRKKKPIPARVAAAIVRDAALGLDYAHHAKDDAGRSLHVVHRDVSPHNLMIRGDGLVKVVDFGVAVAANQLHETQGDKLKGKIRYMSPEQLLGEELDGRSDEFSLGVVLWELLAGRPLFGGNNPIDLFQRILAGEIKKPSDAAVGAELDAAVDVPAVLDDIVMRMLAQKRADRYARLADAAAALRSFCDAGEPSDELSLFVQSVAGDTIADRVKDLTPRAVSIDGIGRGAGPHSLDSIDEGMSIDTAAPTRIVSPHSHAASPSDGDDVATREMARGTASAEPEEDRHGVEHSDAGVLLDAAEHSGVLHGDRRYVTVLVGLLPGWGALAQQINVPMGAFGVSRLKNLFFRQLQQLVVDNGGAMIRRGPDSFVVAFGLEEPSPKDAERALTCAFATQKILDDLAKDPRQRLTAHMGVECGTALATGGERDVHLAGSVVEKAETLAAAARAHGKGVFVSAQVGELARGPVEITGVDTGVAGGVLEATGIAPALQTKRCKILIADDAEVFRRIEEEILRPFAYAFVHAKDGAQAIKLAIDEKPDLILLDIQMPVMDGVQVLSFLKRTPATKHIPIVVVTTIGRAHDEDLMRRGGADAFLTKPVKPGLLIQTVRKLLQG